MVNLYLDLIVKQLQSSGGISVYFSELIKRASFSSDVNLYLNQSNFDDIGYLKDINLCKVNNNRVFERYRDAIVPKGHEFSVFHSSYYRLPSLKTMSVVTTVHDFTYEIYNRGFKTKVHSFQKNKAIRSSDSVICISNNTANDLKKFCNIHDDKINVVYNGVSDSYFNIPSSKITENVLFIGARSGYKNFELAVKAVSNLRWLNLTIVGGGPLTGHEKRLLEKHLKNRYFFLGFLSESDLNIVYNKSYALLYPSSYEGFGIPILEAMKAGCPVIAINSSSIPEVAGNAALLIQKADELELTEALESIEKVRVELISLGLIQSRKFSWENCFNNTLEVYKKFL